MKVRISGIAPHIDGTYEIQLTDLINRELCLIKDVSGIRPLEMSEAVVYGDAGFACAIGTIVCQRAGKRINPDIFLDAPGGSVTFVFGEETIDGDPPTVPGKPGTKPRRSGKRSSRSSASPDPDPSPSGVPTSAA